MSPMNASQRKMGKRTALSQVHMRLENWAIPHLHVFHNAPYLLSAAPPPKFSSWNHCNTPGGIPYNGLYGEASPERGTFFRLQVYERVGILLFEVCERVGKSVIWLCERAQRAEQMNFMAL